MAWETRPRAKQCYIIYLIGLYNQEELLLGKRLPKAPAVLSMTMSRPLLLTQRRGMYWSPRLLLAAAELL